MKGREITDVQPARPISYAPLSLWRRLDDDLTIIPCQSMLLLGTHRRGEAGIISSSMQATIHRRTDSGYEVALKQLEE